MHRGHEGGSRGQRLLLLHHSMLACSWAWQGPSQHAGSSHHAAHHISYGTNQARTLYIGQVKVSPSSLPRQTHNGVVTGLEGYKEERWPE